MKDVIKAREKLRLKILKDLQTFEESTGVRVDGIQLVRPVMVNFSNDESVMSLTGIKLDVTF